MIRSPQQNCNSSTHSRLISSSKKAPCPVCGRTKDGDCRVRDDGRMTLCHTYKDSYFSAPWGWTYRRPTTCGTWGTWVLEDGYDASPPLRSAPPSKSKAAQGPRSCAKEDPESVPRCTWETLLRERMPIENTDSALLAWTEGLGLSLDAGKAFDVWGATVT